MRIGLRPLKRFEDATFELAPLTLLTGVNCGGKTSVLQALIIGRLLAAGAPGRDTFGLNMGSFCGLPLGDPQDYPPFSGDESRVIIDDAAFSLDYSLWRDGRIEINAKRDEAGWSASRWRVCTLASVPIDAEQKVDDRSQEDPLLDGQHALMELADRGLSPSVDPSTGATQPLSVAVEKNLSNLSAPTQVRVQRVPSLHGRLSLEYRARSIESEWTSPAHHGAGVTAILPIVVHMCAAKAGDTLIVQDPEANLHPFGQSLLGRLLVNTAGRGVRVIVESHSEHILNGMRLGVIALKAGFDAILSCYYLGTEAVAGGQPFRIRFDSRGRILEWPAGFFDQAERDLGAILRGEVK